MCCFSNCFKELSHVFPFLADALWWLSLCFTLRPFFQSHLVNTTINSDTAQHSPDQILHNELIKILFLIAKDTRLGDTRNEQIYAPTVISARHVHLHPCPPQDQRLSHPNPSQVAAMYADNVRIVCENPAADPPPNFLPGRITKSASALKALHRSRSRLPCTTLSPKYRQHPPQPEVSHRIVLGKSKISVRRAVGSVHEKEQVYSLYCLRRDSHGLLKLDC